MRQLPILVRVAALAGALAFAGSLVASATASAADDDPTPETRERSLKQYDPGEQAPALPESVTDPRPDLPPLRPRQDYVEFSRHGSGAGYVFSLDPDTLEVRGDEVRVAIRVTSGKGAETVTYEGFDCPDDAYRIYAYGSAGNTAFRPVRRLRWRSARAVDSTSAGGFRKVLIYEFLCDPVRPRAPEAIRTRLRRR